MAYLFTTTSLQHLASDAWFILNKAVYGSPDVYVIMHARVCVCSCVLLF